MNPNLHRHGEVLLKPDRLPEGSTLLEEGKSVIVGHSESGHHHVLVADAKIKVFEHGGEWYLDVPLRARLEHQKTYEKHETQVIEPGIYRRHIKRAYSYAEKVMKKVID